MKIVGKVSSRGGTTVKYIQETSDRFLVEATYINRPEKHIVCFSSQVGCAIGCTFCVSGARKEGAYQRSLTAVELMQQCQNIVDAELGSVSRKAPVEKPLLFSCMGEGEPFLNFKACVSAFHELGRRSWPVPVVRIAVSTSGIRPDLIRRLGEIVFTLPVKLQISLHGPNDEIPKAFIGMLEGRNIGKRLVKVAD